MCQTATLKTGAHTITTNYNGDNNFGSSPGSIPYTVNPATTTAAITAVPQSPSSWMQPVVFTATITATSGGTPNGTVDFTDNNSPITNCTGLTLDKNAQAQCPISTLTITNSPHTIAVNYPGNSNFGPSNTSIAYTVTKANTTTSVVSAPSPSDVNQFVLLTAAVAGVYGGTPTGQVKFTSDGGSIAECPQPVTLVNQQATCKTQTLGVGTHSIVATYMPNGDLFFTCSGSGCNGSLQQIVKPTPTATTIFSTPNPSVLGQPVAFSITVTPQFQNSTSPGGTVDLTDSGTAIAGCTGVVVTNGQAMCSTTALQAGTRTITATYNGDSNFNGSSTTLQQIVEDFSPTVTFTGLVIPGVVTIPQGYTNENQPFGKQTITVSATTSTNFSNSLALACSSSQINGQAPTCSTSPGLISWTNGTASSAVVTVTAGSAPVGNYTVTITATDTVTGLQYSTSFRVLITNTVPSIDVRPGPGTTTPVSFVGATNANVTFSCSQIAPATTGISCSFSPASTTVNPNSSTTVNVTVTTTTQTSQLSSSARILATLWLGMPAIVLIGSLRFGKLSREKVLQLLGILVIVVALLQGIGCGGGINVRPATPQNPGSYNLLVIGTDSSGTVQTSAIVPINVIQ